MSSFTAEIWQARANRLGITVVSAIGGVRDVWTRDRDAWLVTLSCNGQSASFICCNGPDVPTAGEALESIVDSIRMAQFDETQSSESRLLTVRAAREIRRMERELKRLIGPAEYDSLSDAWYGTFALSQEVTGYTQLLRC